MKRSFLALTATALLCSATVVQAEDSGILIIDGITGGVEAQSKAIDEAPLVLKPVVMLLAPLFLAGGILGDTADKIAGN